MVAKFKSGGGSGFKLAPDLLFPSRLVPGVGYSHVNLNPAGSLTTALSLTGKWLVQGLYFAQLTSELITVKLTIDGVVIWDNTFTSGATTLHLNSRVNSSAPNGTDVVCESSFLLQIQTATDTSVDLYYAARPIL